MPKQLSMVIQPLPRWYKCAHAWGAGQAVGLKPWVKPWAPGLFVFQKSSLSSPRGAHLCEFGKILVAELPSREEKWRKVTLARRHHRQNFPRTRTIEPAWRRLRSDIVLSLRTADAFPVVASSVPSSVRAFVPRSPFGRRAVRRRGYGLRSSIFKSRSSFTVDL